MVPQSYKVVNTHSHEISGRNILSRLLHARTPHLGGNNSGFRSDLAALPLNNGEKVYDLHSRIIILQQEIILSGENFPPARLLFQYIKEFSKSNKLKEFIVLKMTDIITFLDKNQ